MYWSSNVSFIKVGSRRLGLTFQSMLSTSVNLLAKPNLTGYFAVTRIGHGE